MNTQTQACATCSRNFEILPEDAAFYDKLDVQPPKWCPECRFKRRMTWRNERTLYKRACALCKKSVITMYNPKLPHPVYCNDCWWSDVWDPATYAKEYDLSRPFFDQLKELLATVPQAATYTTNSIGPNINSEYTNCAGGNKDSYLIFNSGPGNENAAYGRGLNNCRDSFDCYYANGLERSYEIINATTSNSVAWSHNIADCLDSSFLYDSNASSNCFGCVNLRHGQYQFLNEKFSKEEYDAKVGEIKGSYAKTEEFKKVFEKHRLKYPHRANQNTQAVNSTGDYLVQVKDCYECYEMIDCENMRYSAFTKAAKDCMDILGHGRKAELMLEGVGSGAGQRVIATWWVETSHDAEYSVACRTSANIVGCVSMRNGEYCILNKKYSPEEYTKIRDHIVAELKGQGVYGSMIPPALSFFAYNETIGQDNMPLLKEQAIKEGFRWEEELPQTKGQETLKSEQIPDHIKDVQDSILNEVLGCVDCGRNYKLIPPELAFYRTQMIPVPRLCWQCRFSDRIHRRGPMKVFDRMCAKCNAVIKTTYAPDRPEIVYCESCFQKEVL